MGKGLLQLIAIFFILAIIGMPISSTFVFASTIKDFEMSGEAGYNGYVKSESDGVTFKIYVSADPDEVVLPEEVYLDFVDYGSNSEPLDISNEWCGPGSCNKLPFSLEDPNTYECTCISSWAPPTGKPFKVAARYKNAQEFGYITQDYMPPQGDVSVSQGESNLVVEYDLTDHACSGSNCNNKCVGVKQLIIQDDTGTVDTIDFERTDSCSVSGSEEIPYSEEGEQTFIVKAIDFFWSDTTDNHYHSSRFTNDLTTDFTPPSINSNLKIIQDGIELRYISQEGINDADINFLVTDEHLKKITILSAYGNSEKTLSPSDCEVDEDFNYNCTVSGFDIELPETVDTISFDIVVEDDSDNIAEQTITKTLIIDDSNAVVDFIGTSNYNAETGKSYMRREGNTFMMTMTETGSGFSKADVYLNLNSINGESSAKADECLQLGDSWACFWKDVALSNFPGEGYSKPISRVGISKDDAGNRLEGEERSDIIFDSEPPVKPSSENISVMSITDDGFMLFHKSNDILSIKLNISDEVSGIEKVYANFSNIYETSVGVENVTGNCVLVEDHMECSWETDTIRTGYVKTKIWFDAYDYAGNVQHFYDNITIYNPHGDKPDCYTLEYGTIMPIEYTTLKSFPPDFYYYLTVPIRLRSNNCGGDLFNLRFTGRCAAGGSVFVTKNGENYDGFLQLPLDPPALIETYDSGSNEYTIGIGAESSCALIFTSTNSQGFIYTIPEFENVTFKGYITNDLIPPGVSVKEEIDDILADYDGFGEVIATTDKVLSMARSLCNIKNVFSALDKVYVGIKGVLNLLKADPITKPAADGSDSILNELGVVTEETSKKLAVKVFNTFCAVVTCSNEKKSTSKGEGFVYPGGFLPFVYDLAKKILKPAFGGIVGEVVASSGVTFEEGFPATPMELARSNIYISVIGLCLPAFVYHLNKKQQLECWKGYCYYNYIPLGMSKADCDDDYSYQKCVYNNNWLSVLVKWIGLDTIAKAIENIIQNPTSVVWGLTRLTLSKLCYSADPGGVKYFLACIPSLAMGLIEDSITAWGTVENYIGGFNWDNAGQPDYCKQLKDQVENDETWGIEDPDASPPEDTVYDDGGY